MLSVYFEFLIRFALDLGAVAVLLFAIYYVRYRKKEMTITAALFNVFAFSVLTILSTVQFSVAAGFGLFAILALFSLRSEQINISDIAYFFGSISIAVITSIQGTSMAFVGTMLFIVIVSVYVLDHPHLLSTAHQMRVTLDFIPENGVADPDSLNAELSRRLGVKVVSARVLSVNYVTEVMCAEVNFQAS